MMYTIGDNLRQLYELRGKIVMAIDLSAKDPDQRAAMLLTNKVLKRELDWVERQILAILSSSRPLI